MPNKPKELVYAQSQSWEYPFQLINAGKQRIQDPHYAVSCLPEHDAFYPRILIKHSLSGCGGLRSSGQHYEVPIEHAFIILRPGPYHYFYERHDKTWEFQFLTISVPPTFCEDLLPSSLQENPVIKVTDTNIPSQIQELSQHFHASTLHPLEESRLGFQLINECIQAHLFGVQHKKNKNISKTERLRRYLTDNYTKTISLQQCAANLDITHEALTRSFHQDYNMSPNAYLQQIRLRQVQRLLLEEEISMQEIAERCGLGSGNYLARLFKKQFGQSPSAYRRQPNI